MISLVKPQPNVVIVSPPELERMSNSDSRLRQALALWMQWNEAYERATSRMFDVGANPAQLEAVMDQMDEVRRRAVELTQRVLDK